jgi:3-oxoacyl-[acyl-carrier-protein] synthase II
MMALDRGAVPATLNHTNPDPECPIRVHAGEPLPVRTPYVLKVAMTDRGQCAAMIVRKWD